MALRRILSSDEICKSDNSDVGADNGGSEVDEAEDNESDNGMGIVGAGAGDGEVQQVWDLTLKYFFSRLVEHFNIMLERHSVVWPRRQGCEPIEP